MWVFLVKGFVKLVSLFEYICFIFFFINFLIGCLCVVCNWYDCFRFRVIEVRYWKLCKLLLKKFKFVICVVYEEIVGLMVNDFVLWIYKVICLIKFVELFIIYFFVLGMWIFLWFCFEYDIVLFMFIMFNMLGIVMEFFNLR